MKNQQEIVNQVKSVFVSVVQYQESKGYDSFDYGYDIALGVWECEFFNSNDEVVEKIVTNTPEELLQKLSI